MKELQRAKVPFHFYTRLHLLELTGKKARNLKELFEGLKNVPGSVIYHHIHHFLQQHQYLSPEPPNDFAYWAREVLNDDILAEKLFSIDVRDYGTIRSLREKIIAVIEEHLKGTKRPLTVAPKGEEFHFIKSISFIFPTPYRSWDLSEFAEILKKITINVIYFHIFEARLRLEKNNNDFSLWIKDNFQDNELAREIDNLALYSYTMEGLRHKIINLIEERIK